MPTYNITLKPDTDAKHIEEAKKSVTDKGGKILHEFSLIKGFTAEFPEDHFETLSSNDNITVEKDSEVRTQ
ncbi:hypothetical protein B0J11DRAFT_578874 [Dendryphion nanum]|uniref:Inhibitor I9 domain-containing protein n=1 Tax=Dendryphion nanum TaxID=256645 RepID=A0A9P9DZN6_9PLEO|nr:hypothetical protein B0J11DRAFT_578874 [Dendryphion nanum]